MTNAGMDVDIGAHAHALLLKVHSQPGAAPSEISTDHLQQELETHSRPRCTALAIRGDYPLL